MRNWKDAVVRYGDSILTAIESIERGVLQITLVLDNDGRLAGAVTDGDIRRAILQGTPLDQPVETVMNKTPYSITPGFDPEEVKATMLARHLHQVPVVDEDGRIIDLIILDDFIKGGQTRNNWVVLMAGGLGRRLLPLTETTPKPLIEVGGKPLLETIVEKFVNQGFKRFYMSINYMGDQIRDHFGHGEKWDAEIRYLAEDRPLGTAGALGLIEEMPDEPIIVMNADLLTDIDFKNILNFHEEHVAKGTMAVRAYEFKVDFGVVEIENNRISAINEKPVHKFMVNAGIYVLAPAALAEIPKDTPLDMPNLFETWLQTGETCVAFPVHEYWLDVGRIEDLERAQRETRRNSQT